MTRQQRIALRDACALVLAVCGGVLWALGADSVWLILASLGVVIYAIDRWLQTAGKTGFVP